MRTHGGDDCRGQWCCIHNPSDHPLKNAKKVWRWDRGLMERRCDHGIGHPDPDHLSYVQQFPGHEADDIHCCDGCCQS